MEKPIAHHQERVEDVDRRSHSNNMRLVGLPQHTKCPSMKLVLENWLSSMILGDKASNIHCCESPFRVGDHGRGTALSCGRETVKPSRLEVLLASKVVSCITGLRFVEREWEWCKAAILDQPQSPF
ncbi:hypothetical protein NDU88_006523 [Pleurodeles waltl]|uniref:Uncharacterized protein n=1 Tax=Pleurodeles waltl TaxID=8319 RepID=A0AAV7UM57_PLEWA|nr:hypothetical protein NDU88_006523 [Pleurodeles waltl]